MDFLRSNHPQYLTIVGKTAPWEYLGKGTLAFGAAALVENSHDIVGLSPSILGIAAIAALAHGRYASNEAKQDVSDAWQQRHADLKHFRHLHKEPIDVYSRSVGDYTDSIWRWHGLDDRIPFMAGQRLGAIADAAEERGLTDTQPIIVAWDKLHEHFAESDKPIGTVQPAEKVLKELTKQGIADTMFSVEIVDPDGPDQLLRLSIDEARKLAKSLETDANDVLEKLVSATNNGRIHTIFEEYQQGTSTLLHVRDALRRELEMLIDDDYVVQRDDDGLRERFNATAHVSGDRVNRWTSTSSLSTNQPYQPHESVISFAKQVVDNAQDLVSAVLSGKDQQSSDALIAAYLYTLSEPDEVQTPNAGGVEPTLPDYSHMPTTFSRLEAGEAMVQFRRQKIVSAICAVAFGLTGTLSGLLVSQALREAPGFSNVSEAQLEVLLTARATLAERTGIDIAIDKVVGKNFPPPEVGMAKGLSGGLNTSSFGDAPPSEAHPEVTIQSLSGMSSLYWGLQTQNDIYMDAESTVFGWTADNAGVATEKGFYMRSSADFLVERAAPTDSYDNLLPLPQGGHVVDIELFDKADAENVHHVARPTQEVDAMRLHMTPAQNNTMLYMQQPYIRYWVKVLPVKPTPTAFTDAQLGMPSRSGKGDVDYTKFPQDLTQSVRKNLGVAPDATLDQIVTAVRSKYYSYTPLADNDLTFGPNEKLKLTPNNYFNALASLPDANCNTAALTVFAASDPNKSDLSIRGGYIDKNNDSVLSSDEAHAWLVDGDGNIIDPTPSESRKPRALSNAELLSALALGGVAGSIMGWRRGNLSRRAANVPGWNAYLRRVSDKVERAYYGTQHSRPDHKTSLDDRLTHRLPSLQEIGTRNVAEDAHIRNPLSRIALKHLQKIQKLSLETR